MQKRLSCLALVLALMMALSAPAAAAESSIGVVVNGTQVTSAATGQPITVVFQVGELPKEQPQGGAAAPARDKLDDLIGFGSQFDNFKVK